MTPGQDAPGDKQSTISRRRMVIEGIVQGVGFRPFVYRTAVKLGLAGFVRNQSGTVYLEVEGPMDVLDQFACTVTQDSPSLSRVDAVHFEPLALQRQPGFQIAESTFDTGFRVCVSPDIATCDQCLAELFDPTDRRFHYPFLNCTNCGPRLTIIQGVPYDRQRTTMSAFVMCDECLREYQDPENRRFDAQPIACPRCGPQLRLLTNRGIETPTNDPIFTIASAIRQGQIGALKGLGGFHLFCDAASEVAVAELRRRKNRDQKPFAVMVRDLESAEHLCHINPLERELLCSARRPIVLLKVRDNVEERVAHSVAPDNPQLGLMLPYTPLHHLLLEELEGHALVMTSGNRSDEPIAFEDDDAVKRLGEIADLILTHNRQIHVRCDDSVMRVVRGCLAPIRRARGYAPDSVQLPAPLPCPTLAVGGQLKSTFALGCEQRACLSHHMGDLDHFSAFQAFEHDVKLYEELFSICPQQIVHDLHPDYASTNYAQRRAASEGLKLLPVQHHHAHIASGMAEHGLTGPVIGVAFDGTGYGTDGAIWGGEFLVADYAGFQRAAHLRYVGLPGGDAAIRSPWRSAVAHLIDSDCGLSLFASSVSREELRAVEQMVHRRFNTPSTSSMGRLFDAVAAIAGVRTHVSYEGQAAMELEWLAAGSGPAAPYPFEVVEQSSSETHPQWIIDTRSLIRAVEQDVIQKCEQKSRIARRFHSTIVKLVVDVCIQIQERWASLPIVKPEADVSGFFRKPQDLKQVVLTGGVFMNAVLATEVTQKLVDHGFQVFSHQKVPPNDGGLCLGQLAIAAATSR